MSKRGRRRHPGYGNPPGKQEQLGDVGSIDGGAEQPNKASEIELGIIGEQGGMDADSLIRSFLFHLGCTLAKDQYTATNQDRYQALALAVRDRLVGRWIQTQQAYHNRTSSGSAISRSSS